MRAVYAEGIWILAPSTSHEKKYECVESNPMSYSPFSCATQLDLLTLNAHGSNIGGRSPAYCVEDFEGLGRK